MKKILLAGFILVMIIASAPAQSTAEITQMETAFENFANVTAPALPFYSTIGLQWSDPYIGGFPHFGVGVSMGVIGLPVEGFESILTTLDFALPQELQDFSSFGLPLPGYAVEGRIGGLILPVDIGVKVATVPPDIELDPSTSFDYTMLGFDVRYALIKEGFIQASVGAGYNSLLGSFSKSDLLGGNITLEETDVQDPYNGTQHVLLELQDPSLAFEFNNQSVDVEGQVALKLLPVLTAYAGGGISYSIYSYVKSGLYTNILYNGNEITEEEADQIQQALEAYGVDIDLSQTGFESSNSIADVWAPRAYAGASINLLFLTGDMSVMYNINSKTWGGQLGVRAQF